MADSWTLNVDSLAEYALDEKVPALTSSFAGLMQEAVVMCMSEYQHLSGVSCDVRDLKEVLTRTQIVWAIELTDNIVRAFGSATAAAELAGEGIAILAILTMTSYTIIERSIKGTGVDFWLGDEANTTEDVIQREARMEVKGRTRIEFDKDIRSAVRKGVRQTERSAASKLPACVILTEFSRPVIYMVWA